VIPSPIFSFIIILKNNRNGFSERKRSMAVQNIWHGPADYQIKVKGKLGNQWSDWFAGITIESEGDVTILNGKQLDQSALHGLLVRVRDLGLPLISVKRVQTR